MPQTRTISETDKAIKEIWALFKETDKKLDKVAEEQKKTDEQIKTSLKNWDRKFGDLTSKWSKFIEGIIEPGAVKMFKARGIPIEETQQHVKVKRNGQVAMEIDILLVNATCVVVIEVKSSLKVADVKEHIERIQKFKKVFPRYRNYEIIGAVAGIAIEEKADRYAYHQGLFVIGQTGETAKILNDKKFKPKIW